MLRIAAFALATMFLAAPALAEQFIPADRPNTLAEIQEELVDVRSDLAAEWSHARDVKEELQALEASGATATPEGKARQAQLLATLDMCRVRIEEMRSVKRDLVEERVALTSGRDAPTALAEALPAR